MSDPPRNAFGPTAVDGEWITTVSLPPVDRVLEIGSDYVLATWSGELDVEYVGLFGLRRD